MEDWIGASVWKVGRTAEDRLMYGRSVKAATSGNGYANDNNLLHIVVKTNNKMINNDTIWGGEPI